MGIGSMGVYQSPAELDHLMLSLDDQFPELVRKFTLGQTYHEK
jgi:hypothetical protein